MCRNPVLFTNENPYIRTYSQEILAARLFPLQTLFNFRAKCLAQLIRPDPQDKPYTAGFS